MVPCYQDLMSIQPSQYGRYLPCVHTAGKIAQMIDRIFRPNHTVPVFNHLLIHLMAILKGSSLIFQYCACIAKMGV